MTKNGKVTLQLPIDVASCLYWTGCKAELDLNLKEIFFIRNSDTIRLQEICVCQEIWRFVATFALKVLNVWVTKCWTISGFQTDLDLAELALLWTRASLGRVRFLCWPRHVGLRYWQSYLQLKSKLQQLELVQRNETDK